MWIKISVLLCCLLAACLAVDEHKPKSSAKKDESRGKRNLDLNYAVSHHYSGPHSYRVDRRISTAPQIPLYHSPFFPGPRSYSPYHKGRPRSLHPPPYAVQMEPLVQYSQRDPLYDTNALSLHTDGHSDDLLTDNNHLTENVYGPPKHQIIERPVYIKEPEPIIEIIIKESNVSLPAPPTPPPPPPKKKEQVQVFYVKYKKNPNGHGKDSIIYDKPVPAISPPIHDEHEHEEEQQQEYHHHHQEVATAPPPPSTTLRTIIHPESETYHSPSGVKVTFGKEGFDYGKRSNKPEDLNAASVDHRSVQFPQGRQLSSFNPNIQRRPQNFNFKSPPSFRSEPPSFRSEPPSFRSEPPRQPQPYRPFTQQPPQFRPAPNFPRPNPAPQQYSTLPKFVQFPQQPKGPTIQFTTQRPNLPQFHQQPQPPLPHRQPVPYQPFENLRQNQQHQFQFRPQTHFPVNQQAPLNQPPTIFNKFNSQPTQAVAPNHQQNYQNQDVLRQQQIRQQEEQRQKQIYQQQQQLLQRPVQHQPQFQQHQQPQFPQQQLNQQNQNVVPPGGELIAAVPKFEQHISVIEPNTQQRPQALGLHRQQTQVQQQQHSQNYQTPEEQSQNYQISQQQQQQQQQSIQNHLSQDEYNDKIQQQIREANALQESIRSSSQLQDFNIHQSQQQQNPNPIFYQSTTRSTTPRSTTTTTKATTTTTTEEPETPSTTTKDPKLLNAQLPDEVPDDLREQLLSSGILNNADISVLDYDKVGDIPLSALPPDQLANFYSAGGAQQLAAAGSAPIPTVLTKDGAPVDNYETEEAEASEKVEVRAKPEVQMKVVHYDPQTERGQRVQESYVKDDATQVDPVVLNDAQYNRYLPLKVSGAQFPIPDVPELKGKKISSVVVLAPITYDFAATNNKRQTREAKNEDIDLIQGSELKELLKNPSLENYKKFLETENKTKSDKQAVILLVTGPSESSKEKEIYMYDIATKTVNKLNGELSAAFVEAAEANASDEESQEVSDTAASNIIETRVPYSKTVEIAQSNDELEEAASDFAEVKVPIIDPMDGDLEPEASEHLESFVDISGMPVGDDLTAAASETHHRLGGSREFSKTGRILPSS